MNCTVMIATRDRVHSLEHTCSQLELLRPLPREVIVCADGCRDGTVEMVRKRFPRFKLLVNSAPRGSVFSRDRMLRSANGEIVLSLDDDSWPVQPDFIARLVQAFAAHPEAAVITFAELPARRLSPLAARAQGCYVAAYANCGAAMRRGVYLRNPGFVFFFGHMYEEPDYAVQCYARGGAVWFEPGLAVRHELSMTNRLPVQRHHCNARNELWSVWLRSPWPWTIPVSAYRLARQFFYAASEGITWAVREPIWWAQALKGFRSCLEHREPVSWAVYYQWMRLARNPAYSFPELCARFPAFRRAPSHGTGDQTSGGAYGRP